MISIVKNYLFQYKRGLLFSLLLLIAVQVGASVQSRIADDLRQLLNNNPHSLPELNEQAVIDFYRQRKYTPLWLDGNNKLNRAFDLFRTIVNADNDGLAPGDYLLGDIKRSWYATQEQELAYLDLLLTAALYRYSSHVYSGASKPVEMDAEWHINHSTLDINSLLIYVAGNKSISSKLDQLPPQNKAYLRLKQLLQRYQELDRLGGWQEIIPGPVLEVGVQHAQVEQLRRRLEQTGDLDGCNICSIDIFDHALEEAVRRFQQRHGLQVDGKVGPETRKELNIPVSDRIRQIRVNMERWRWMPRTLGERYVMVNMTGFELYLVEDDNVKLTMPVIIGKSYRATPSFSGRISIIEYNPYWTVPVNLTIRDFVPQLIRDASVLEKKSIKLYRGWGANAEEIDPQTVNWDRLDSEHFPYWLRQDPGPKNAMGMIKFLFPNKYEIYLHGTPDRHLFDRAVRTFSSGCIRVKDPVKLAAYLLDEGSLQKEEEIMADIHLGSNQSVRLEMNIPIYLVYWTAWIDEEGRINYRPDVYGRDKLLDNLFQQPPIN